MIEYVDRRGSNSYKWDSDHAAGCLPLWVADMDFRAAPAILAAMQRRLDHGVFGYTCVPQAYYDAITSWFSRRHGWHGITRNQIIYTTGVVPAISAILRAMTRPGDKVMTLTPAYNCFFSSIRNLQCQLVSSPLQCVNRHYEVDWLAFERDIQGCRVFLLCNPHNPTGRFWTREELTRMRELCEKAGVFVISDEIHCEFVFPGQQYVPYATVGTHEENTAGYCVCTAASKAFNIAGLQCANIFVPSPEHYALIDKAINVHEICDINPFGMDALIAAYNESEQWLDELCELIYGNYRLLCEALNDTALRITRMEGTYLAWVDITATEVSAQQLCDCLQHQEKILFNPSEMYGAMGFIRINLATSADNLTHAAEALKRLLRTLG